MLEIDAVASVQAPDVCVIGRIEGLGHQCGFTPVAASGCRRREEKIMFAIRLDERISKVAGFSSHLRSVVAAAIMVFAALAMAGCGDGGGGGGAVATTPEPGAPGSPTTLPPSPPEAPPPATPDAPVASVIPATAIYDVTITGTTFSGNTNFPGPQTAYTPSENFSLAGVLVVVPTLDRSGANIDNGVNPRDVGLFVGNPAGTPAAGAVWYVTNSELTRLAGFGNIAQGLAQIDLAFVALDEATGTILIRVDDRFVGTPISRTSQINIFDRTGGLFGSVFQIVGGGMDLQFQQNGTSVQGASEFVGTGLIGPGSAAVRMTIAGTLRQ